MRRLLGTMLLLWIAAAGIALAQEAPPCPCPEPPPPPPPVWFGKLNFSFLSTSGNTDTTSIGGAAEVNYNPKPFLFTFKGAYLYSATEGVTTAQATTLGLRGSMDLTERLDVFAGAGYLRNTFSGINNLYSIDAGAGYKLFKGPTQFLRVEGGLGWTSEEDILQNGTVVPSRSYMNARAGVAYKWQFTKSAAFTNDFGFLARPRPDGELVHHEQGRDHGRHLLDLRAPGVVDAALPEPAGRSALLQHRHGDGGRDRGEVLGGSGGRPRPYVLR